VGKPEERYHREDQDVDRLDNLKMDLREIGWDGADWMDMAQDRGSCEHGIEPSGSIKCWEVFEGLHNWWLLKKGSAP
jgi:hypothetical protein